MFKRSMCFLLCILMLVAIVIPVSANTGAILNADFEEASGFTSASGTFSLTGGSVKIFNDGYYSASVDQVHGRYMSWECDTAEKSTYVPVTLTSKPQSDYVISMDFCWNQLAQVKSSSPVANLIQLYSLSPAKEWYNLVNLDQNGTIYAFTGEGGQNATRVDITRLEADTWYTIKVFIDVSTEQYTIKVNDGENSQVLRIASSATAGDYKGIVLSEIRLMGFSKIISGKDKVSFDNINVSYCSALDYPADEGSMYTNLFDADSVSKGYYGTNGTLVEDSSYQTRRFDVSAGSTLTVAPLSSENNNVGALFDESGNFKKLLTLEDLTLKKSLGATYGIYEYEIPDGCSSLALTVFERRAYITLVTQDASFDDNAYYQYWGISKMTGNEKSPLWQKSALFAGDSISAGFADTTVGNVNRAWAGRAAYNHDMTYVNVAVSGATLSEARDKRIVDQIKGVTGDFDYVLLQGGINDASENVPIGAVSESKNVADFDVSTYAGALEELFATAKSAYPNADIGFVVTFNATATGQTAVTYGTYIDITKQICEKWEIPMLDWYSDITINEIVLSVSTTDYMADSVHPNSTGYDRLTPYIEDFLASITSVANEPEAPEDDSAGTEESAAPDKTNGDATSETSEPPAPDTEEKKGCGSSLGGGVALIAILMVMSCCLLTRKRKIER